LISGGKVPRLCIKKELLELNIWNQVLTLVILICWGKI
jgi:hypothetical protein